MPARTSPAPRRLAALAFERAASGARVDRKGLGRLLGVSLARQGEAKGHGFRLGAQAIREIAEQADGRKGRWTHPGLCADGLGHYLGRWHNPRVVETTGAAGPELAALADFHFSRAAHQFMPDGLTVSAADYLMDRAETEPGALGVSVVARFERVDGEEPDEDEDEDEHPEMRLAGPRALEAADFVDEPAANDGLFADGPSALASAWSGRLDEIIERVGEGRAMAFLSGYAARRGIALGAPAPNPKGETMTDATKQDETTALRGRLEAAERALKAREEADRLRQEKDAEAFVAKLRADALGLQSPIGEEDLKYLGELVRKDEEAARRLGAALLSTAKLKGGTADKPLVRLGASVAQSDEDERAYTLARLRAAGVREDNPHLVAVRGRSTSKGA